MRGCNGIPPDQRSGHATVRQGPRAGRGAAADDGRVEDPAQLVVVGLVEQHRLTAVGPAARVAGVQLGDQGLVDRVRIVLVADHHHVVGEGGEGCGREGERRGEAFDPCVHLEGSAIRR
jgi:hypothetical protein